MYTYYTSSITMFSIWRLQCTRDHLCNRYCGGSHTVITPQQRILRTGHFLTQWGPEAIQLSDGLIRGKDGQMYRGQPLTCKQDICESMCWESQVNDEARRQVLGETYFCYSKRFVVCILSVNYTTLLFQISQERVPSASRKPLTSQRNSVTPREWITQYYSYVGLSWMIRLKACTFLHLIIHRKAGY